MSENKKRRFGFRRKKQQKQPVKVKRNYAFIDSQNLNLGTQKMGWKMDWKKFRKFLEDTYNVEKAYMFIGYVPDNEDLYKQMKEAGYTVVLKPTVDMLMTKEELAVESHVTKGNADAELVLYAMKELPYYEKAVVVSGDGDFYCLVEYLIKVNKFSTLLTPNSHYSSLLEKFSSNIVNIDSFKKELVYEYVKNKKHGQIKSGSQKNKNKKNSSSRSKKRNQKQHKNTKK